MNVANDAIMDSYKDASLS